MEFVSEQASKQILIFSVLHNSFIKYQNFILLLNVISLIKKFKEILVFVFKDITEQQMEIVNIKNLLNQLNVHLIVFIWMGNVFVLLDILRQVQVVWRNVQIIVLIMDLENVYVIVDIIMIMEYVKLENHVLLIVQEILRDHVSVFQDILSMEISALDVQVDKFG